MNPVSDHLIVIPVFNEAATIGDIVERARLHGPVLVVDDGSDRPERRGGRPGRRRGRLAGPAARQGRGAASRLRRGACGAGSSGW